MPKALALPVPPPQVQAVVLRSVFALPRPLKRAIAGNPVRLDGQQLALDAQLLLTMQKLTGQTTLAMPDHEDARRAMSTSSAVVRKTTVRGVEVTDRQIPTAEGSLGARLYRPDEVSGTSGLMVFYHGGGWVIGDLDSHDDLCRFLAKRAGIRVLSVDYRLAPEHPFPAAIDDARAAYNWALEHAAELGTTREQIAVGGDSAGGNMAAVVSLEETREGTRPLFQLLLYPAVDATKRRRSRELFGEGFLLTDSDMDWFLDHYHPDRTKRDDPRLSVLLADDLSGLPPAHVVTGGFDPLRDEGEAFAARLVEAGVPVITRRYSDLIHGFASLRQVSTRFHEALSEIVGTVRAGMALGR
jgi:acetyl esterase